MRSVIFNRIDNLIRHLEDACDSDTWWKTLDLEDNQEGLSITLWRRVLNKIYSEADDDIEKLYDARKKLENDRCEERETWGLYEEVCTHSESIFRESLELLAGLALRARVKDDKIANIYRLSDGLIRESANNLATASSFAIPAFELEEAVSSTLRRVARVRFPEWTVWTLPLVAYEYAYVALEEPDLGRQPARFAKLVPLSTVSDGREKEEAALTLRVRVLLADALATYTIGPAYACSALLLRLQPINNERPTKPSDIDRAAMILGMLKCCGKHGEQLSEFSDVYKLLADRWSRTLSGMLSLPPHEDASSKVLDLIPPLDPEAVLRTFNGKLGGDDKYFSPLAWITVRSYAQRVWQTLVQGANPFSNTILDFLKDKDPPLKLRDALNVLWYIRLGVIGPKDGLFLSGELPVMTFPVGTFENQLIESLGLRGTELCRHILGA